MPLGAFGQSWLSRIKWTIVTDRIPIRVCPMLALPVPTPFHRPGWVFEEKYDGIRILAYKEGASVKLLSEERRSSKWLKVKVHQEFVIGGFTAPAGARKHGKWTFEAAAMLA
jgi:ATP-dependent DNA ligase